MKNTCSGHTARPSSGDSVRTAPINLSQIISLANVSGPGSHPVGAPNHDLGPARCRRAWDGLGSSLGHSLPFSSSSRSRHVGSPLGRCGHFSGVPQVLYLGLEPSGRRRVETSQKGPRLGLVLGCPVSASRRQGFCTGLPVYRPCRSTTNSPKENRNVKSLLAYFLST